MSISPAAVLRDFISPQRSSVMSRKRVHLNRSLVARSGDHARILVKAVERSQIEMIKVGVRQKDNVDSGKLVEFEGGRGQSFRTDGESR